MAEKKGSASRVKWVAVAVAVALGAILMLQNTESVPIDWLFWTWDASLVVFAGLIALLGFVAGWLVGRR